VAVALSIRADALLQLGRPEEAFQAIEEAVRLKLSAGDANVAIALFRRADVHAALGRAAEATADTRLALERAREAGNADQVARARIRLAVEAARRGDEGALPALASSSPSSLQAPPRTSRSPGSYWTRREASPKRLSLFNDDCPRNRLIRLPRAPLHPGPAPGSHAEGLLRHMLEGEDLDDEIIACVRSHLHVAAAARSLLRRIVEHETARAPAGVRAAGAGPSSSSARVLHPAGGVPGATDDSALSRSFWPTLVTEPSFTRASAASSVGRGERETTRKTFSLPTSFSLSRKRCPPGGMSAERRARADFSCRCGAREEHGDLVVGRLLEDVEVRLLADVDPKGDPRVGGQRRARQHVDLGLAARQLGAHAEVEGDLLGPLLGGTAVR